MQRPNGAVLMWLVAVAFITMVSLTYVNSQTVLPESYRRQIANSADDVRKIQDYIFSGNGRNQTFERLAWLGDSFGFRLTGTQLFEDVLDVLIANLTEEFGAAHGENVVVPQWTRGNEYAELISPRHYLMPILGLGRSVGTIDSNSSCNCTIADVVVVNSFAHLDRLALADQVRGKIVVYNVPWQGSYGETVQYRQQGAYEAEQKGAVAALIRSVTQYSIWSPHTGGQRINVTIPGACISVEDAEMLQRMYDRGLDLKIKLYMEARVGDDTISRNVISEIKGSEFPDETVIFGGHIDAWDTGTGSMDDGGGVMIAWQAMSVIKALGLQPRRTLRLVLWTAEEQGLIGGIKYYEDHQAEVDNVSLIIESDGGAFKPRGVRFTGNTTATLIMEEIVETMMSDINATAVIDGGASSDTGDWVRAGVPGMELYSFNEDYFHYHHTHGDTMTVLDREDLDRCTALWATVIYTVANLDTKLPRVNCPELGAEYCSDSTSATTATITDTTGISGSNAEGARWLTLLIMAVVGLVLGAQCNR